MGVCRQMALQEANGKCPGAATELEDGMRGLESTMRDQFIEGWVLVKALPILPGAEPVIETLRFKRHKVATRWLSNAHIRIPAVSAFGRPLVAQTPGIAN